MIEKARVLIVDDDPGVLRLAAKVLDMAGYDVHACGSGTDATKFLLGNKVDLLLTDRNLGEMSGVDLAKGARELLPDLPIVLMTGSPDRHALSALNFQGYLVKPFRNNKAIQDAVATAIESHRARRDMERKLEQVKAQLTPIKKSP